MPQQFDANAFGRQMQAAHRKAEQDARRALERAAREADAQNRRAIAEYNRKAEQHNRKVAADYNRQVDNHNRAADRHNSKVIDDINRQLRNASEPAVVYTTEERGLVDRVHEVVATQSERKRDVFLSYAQIDGKVVAGELRDELEALGISVWFDAVTIQPGISQSLQMDRGLRDARTGVVLLTAAYLAGRFWTERELGALLGKPMLIPVLHNVTFEDVTNYSGILPDLSGFTTDRDTIPMIAAKIADAVRPAEAA